MNHKMSQNDFYLEFNENCGVLSNLNFNLENNFDFHESLDYIDRAIGDSHININISKNDNKSSSSEESNVKQRSNSNKSRNMPDIEEYFTKDEKLCDWLDQNNNIEILIIKEIKTLLEKIFDKRYKLYPNNVCSLSEYSTYIKNKVDIYCNEDREMSIYILYVLNNSFKDLMKYIDEITNIETLKMADYQSIKEIIYHIGKDLKKIFKEAVNTLHKGFDFEFSNVLFVKFNDYLKENNKLKEPELVHAALIQENKEFVKCFKNLNEIKYTRNLAKWILDTHDEIMMDDNQQKNKKNKNNDNNLNNNISESKENKFNNICNSPSKKNKSKKKDNSNNEQSKDNIDLNISQNESDNKDVNNLKIEDLVSFINEPKTKNNNKKKNKKKKNKKKEKNDDIIQENKPTKENNNESEKENDLIVDEFKKSIEEFTTKNNKFLYPKKIEPCISESFIKLLESY